MVNTTCSDSVWTSHETLRVVLRLSPVLQGYSISESTDQLQEIEYGCSQSEGMSISLNSIPCVGKSSHEDPGEAKLPETEGLFHVFQYSGLPGSKLGCFMRTKQVATVLYKLTLDVCSQQLQTSPFNFL